MTTPDGVRRQAVVNIGYRPTVSEDGASSRALSIEAHIIDFIGYIYDEEITVDFISYLRAEKAFPTTARLAAQVKDDIAAAKSSLKTATRQIRDRRQVFFRRPSRGHMLERTLFNPTLAQIFIPARLHPRHHDFRLILCTGIENFKGLPL